MTNETMLHLNTNTLIGNTDHRGKAWSYRAELQGEESNHYPGPIPIGDVRRRLFGWVADTRAVALLIPCGVEEMTQLDNDGVPCRWVVQADLQGITRSDTHERLGIFGDGYQRHQYDQWLLNTVSNILDDQLSISSAGVLRNGAIAWVEVSVPDSITTPEGVVFRPNLLATTSFDGSIATTFKRTVTDTVCDNTRAMALSEKGQEIKYRHSRNSIVKLADVREALAIVHTLADDFAAEIKVLCETTVTDKQWAQFLDAHVPLVNAKGDKLEGRSLTIADNKRSALHKLYVHDMRVAPWAGTAHGVLQAVNTYEHHEGTVRGSTRAERNMLRTVTGEWDSIDRGAWARLARVLDLAPTGAGWAVVRRAS
jgi:phage/plasmid-like protein (TIGR03299 family)